MIVSSLTPELHYIPVGIYDYVRNNYNCTVSGYGQDISMRTNLATFTFFVRTPVNPMYLHFGHNFQ